MYVYMYVCMYVCMYVIELWYILTMFDVQHHFDDRASEGSLNLEAFTDFLRRKCCMCVYICMCVCVCVYVCIYIFMCVLLLFAQFGGFH